MFLSNVKFYVKSTISSTQGVWTTFKISEDFETGTHIETGTNNVSIVLKTQTQIERLTITATGWTATIVLRWLTQADTKVADVWLQKQWNDWTIGYITAFASDLLDIDKVWDRQTISNDFWIIDWKKLYIWNNAYITTTNNWTDLKLKDWNNSETTLSDLTAWTGTDHKVKASNTDTTQGFLTEKLTAGDWISKTITNPWANEVIDLDIDLTDTTIFTTDWTSSRAVVTTADWIFQATTTKRGWVELATNAEVLAWTDETRYVNPKQVGTTISPSDSVIASSNAGAYTTSTSYVKVKEGVCIKSWNYRIKYIVRTDTNGSNRGVAKGRLYKNWVALWTEKEAIWYIAETASSEDFPFVAGDLIQIYCRNDDIRYNAYIYNFQICWNEISNINIPTINL